MDPATQQPLLPGAIAKEAERLGADLARLLAAVPAVERGSVIGQVIGKALGGLSPAQPGDFPDELLQGFQDGFPAKQVIPQALKDWVLKNLNLEKVESEFREVRETGGLSFDELCSELEKLAKTHE